MNFTLEFSAETISRTASTHIVHLSGNRNRHSIPGVICQVGQSFQDAFAGMVPVSIIHVRQELLKHLHALLPVCLHLSYHQIAHLVASECVEHVLVTDPFACSC